MFKYYKDCCDLLKRKSILFYGMVYQNVVKVLN